MKIVLLLNAFTNNLHTKDQVAVETYTIYLVRYIFKFVHLTDLNFVIKHELLPLILHFKVKKINKICLMNASIHVTPKY